MLEKKQRFCRTCTEFKSFGIHPSLCRSQRRIHEQKISPFENNCICYYIKTSVCQVASYSVFRVCVCVCVCGYQVWIVQRHMKRAQMAKVSRVFHMHMCKQPALCSRYNQSLENVESERKIISPYSKQQSKVKGGACMGCMG